MANDKTKQQLFDEINGIYKQFEEAHNGTRGQDYLQARKMAVEIKKLVTPYNKASVAEQRAGRKQKVK